MNNSVESLTKVQEAQTYCVKHGHADYIFKCFGYIHCGRCGEQIGDQLASVYDDTNKAVIGHKCEICNKISSGFSKLDKIIFNRLEKAKPFTDHEKILKGLKF